ncbi:hypothetical protein HMPREF1870_00952 [Bacteroidales bacterium KA00344]|nr:hypothetical protein HMPREF1870_00952 [Bacteroidales bacterium KA00344]
MNNRQYYRQIQAEALRSVFWSTKAVDYHLTQYYDYAPMIADNLFLEHFAPDAVVGVPEVEAVLGRRLKVEELKPCNTSVGYFLFGSPIIAGGEREKAILDAFKDIIAKSILRYESRAIGYELKRLFKLQES